MTYQDRQHCGVCGKEHHWNDDQETWWCIDLYRNYTSMCPEDMTVICLDCVPKVRESLMKMFPKWARDWGFAEKAKKILNEIGEKVLGDKKEDEQGN